MKRSINFTISSTLGTLIVLSLVVFALTQISKLNTSYSIRQFFPKQHPLLSSTQEVEKAFELHANPSFLLVIDLPASNRNTWLSDKEFSLLEEITHSLAGLDNIQTTTSLSNIQLATDIGQEFRVGGLKETIDASLWASTIEKQALIKKQLISSDHRSVLIVVEPKDLSTLQLKTTEENIRGRLQKFDERIEYGIAGVPALQSQLAELLKSELTKFLFLSLLIFVGMFLAFYRSISVVGFVLVGLAVVNTVALGAVSYFQIAFTSLLTTLPIVVSIAFVSLVIHTLYYWADRLKQIESKTTSRAQLFSESLVLLKQILLANFLGSLTTGIGFAALVVTPIPAIKEYALVIFAGVMLTFVITQILFATYLNWIRPVQRNWIGGEAKWMMPILKNAKAICISVTTACLLMAAFGPTLNFSGRLFDDLPENTEVRAKMRTIDETLGGTVNLDVSLKLSNEGAWKEVENLALLRSSLIQIRNLVGVGTATGLTDFLSEKLPSSSQAAAEMFFLFSMSATDPLKNFVTADFSETRLSLRLKDLPSDEVTQVRLAVQKILSSHFKSAKIIETGMAINGHTINQEVAKELVFGFWQSMLVIGLLLALIFRSLRWALVACIPNLVAPATLIGAMALAQTPVKPVVGLIFSIALGLAFNNTVYMLARLRQMQRKHADQGLALERAMLDEGNPCLSESLLTLAGFMVFLSSDFNLNLVFGVYMVISIIAGAIGDLVYLPALLKLFPNILRAGNSQDSKPTHLREKSAAAAAVFLFSLTAHADPSAEDLLAKARKNVEAKSDIATVTLRIIEANGSEKIRKVHLKTLNQSGTFKALARVLEPVDVKGTALLAEIKDGTENQWLYLPSSDQVRRVVSGKKSSGVLGSELNPNDLNSEALRGASAKIVSQDSKSATIEITPTPGSSEYTKSVLVLSMPETLPLTNTYFIGEKEHKKVHFKSYVSLGKLKRPKLITVENLSNGRSTKVEFSGLKVNKKMQSSEFTQAALKDDEN